MCDSNNNNKCRGSVSDGPPEQMPSWLKCPPSLKEKNYPVPQGVDIVPISVGGRNGSSTKKKFKCGQCGQDKPPTNTKPKASADCPMMRGRCEDTQSSKSGGFIAKIKEFFGIGKDPRLVELCEKLQVPDEQIRHHRDVFNAQLFVRQDGYMTPFVTKVDCQQADDCEDEEEDDEEDCDEDYDNDDNDDECIEDAEGECVLEETAECMDEDCKLFLDGKPGENQEEDGEDCEDEAAVNNFIIRVQAPFSMSSTNETCEEIIARLTNRKQYPEPDPKPEKGCDEFVIKQISVEDGECPQPKKKCKKKAPKPMVDDCQPNPPAGICPQPEGIPCPPGCPPCPPCPEEKVEEQPTETEPPPPEPTAEAPPPPLPPQNDCETLTELELLSKRLKDIRCGCPKPCPDQPEGPFPGLTCYGGEGTSVWTPPPPPPCPRCGVAVRGDTDGCYLCHITRRMRSGLPEANVELPREFEAVMKISDKTEFCTPQYLEDGSVKYQGGACLSLTQEYMWNLEKANPYKGQFYERFRRTCCNMPVEEPKEDNCPKAAVKPKYKGGMSINECMDYLWGKEPAEPENQQQQRKCKNKEQKPPSADKCPSS